MPANRFIKRSEILGWPSTGIGYGPNLQSSDKSQVLRTGGIAIGTGVVANGMCQTVIGRGNVSDPSQLFIIGNGRITPAYNADHEAYSDTLDRSNALTVDWAGNQVLAGKLTVGAQPTAANDVTTKTYVDTSVLNLENIIAYPYDDTASYYENEYCIYENVLYKALTDTAGGDFEPSDWEEIQITNELDNLQIGINNAQNTADTTNSKIATDFKISNTYNVGNLRNRGEKLIKCNTAIPSPEAWTPAHWTETTVGTELESIQTTIGDNNSGLVKKVGDLETNMPTVTDTYSSSSHDGMSGIAVAGAIAQIPNNYQLVRYSMLITGDGSTTDFDIYASTGAETIEYATTDLLDVYVAGLHKSTAHYSISSGTSHDYKISFNTAPGSGDEIEIYWQRLNGNTILPSQGVGF